MGSKHNLRGKKRHKLVNIGGYLKNNAHRMCDEAYLAAGYPIASGVIEGACRHFIKDRLVAIRERCQQMLELACADRLHHFAYHPDRGLAL
jgi:hypothetical protein